MPVAAELRYRRVLVKLSGEAMLGELEFGMDPGTVARIAGELRTVHTMGAELAIVIGGGNIFRGVAAGSAGVERVTGDYMGMLATVINALALQSALEAHGVYTRVMSAIPMHEVCESYIRRRAVRHMEKGRVVILAAGTGNPYFTTDTAAALRASELGCDVLLKGTKVDGVYSADPRRVADAERYESLTYHQVLARDLKVMDAAAVSLARENRIPIVVFSIQDTGALPDVVSGKGRFTIIREEG